jgi:hypothetical protein
MVARRSRRHSWTVTTYEQTRPETRPTSPATPWLAAGGIALLACALVTGSAQSTGDFRWWSVFVLVPGALIGAVGAVLWARSGWRSAGGYVVTWVGIQVYAIGALLAFGAMRSLWALTIILPSLAVAGGYAWRPADPIARAFHRTIAMLALAGVALGVTMLALDAVGEFDRMAEWWPWFMILGGVIVVGNGLELLRHRLAYRVPAAVLATGPGLIAIVLGIRFLNGWPGIS